VTSHLIAAVRVTGIAPALSHLFNDQITALIETLAKIKPVDGFAATLIAKLPSKTNKLDWARALLRRPLVAIASASAVLCLIGAIFVQPDQPVARQ
jgi:hypothetical protein